MKKIFFVAIFIVLLSACARVGSPEGGAKDTTPPKFLKSNIDTSRVNVPTSTRELRLYFDEYINLKDANKNLIISPPIKKIKKIIPSNLANKYISITWDEDLQENTTYNFNFGNAIVDNNEGNVLPYFNFAFSTGKELDNLYISGTITDALLIPEKPSKHGIVVGLYADSADFKQKPNYITKADEDGYFELNYLSKGKYSIIAFEDENENSVYDAGKEKVGFLKEKIDLSQNLSGLKMKIYPSEKNIRYKETTPVSGGMLMVFEGNPNKVDIKSISYELTDYQITHSEKSDSVMVWVGKQNALNNRTLTPLKISYNADGKEDTISVSYKTNEKDELTLANNKGGQLPPEKDFVITANMALKEINPALWALKSDSISQKFEARISEKNPKEIIISSDFKAGKKYSLSIPKGSVQGHYFQNPKAYIFNFEADKAENYGSLTLKLENQPKSYFWIQLIDSEGNVKYSQYTNKNEIRFTSLDPAIYYARILVDDNGNKYWDKANFSEQKFAEEAFVFEKKLEVRKLWEIVENWVLE